jgi:DNA polymerase V
MRTFTHPIKLAPSTTLIPLYGVTIPAGFPSPAQDFIEPSISLDELMSIRAPHVYLMRCSGMSMRDAGILDGDILVVDRAAVAVPGDVVVASFNNDPVVKHLEVHQGVIVALRSANPEYPDIEPQEGDVVEIWGVVTSSVRLHRR